MLPQPARGRKFTESQSMDFYVIGINKHFLLAKKVLIVMVPILINKHVFQPNYNNVKFIV